ncbi:hypothetical protein MJT46_011086 [Ovis ammon polii x Ovis aries]|nr:hypothetical protein MJT46_011086 [Ovis ammon polii x Ovis aries]
MLDERGHCNEKPTLHNQRRACAATKTQHSQSTEDVTESDTGRNPCSPEHRSVDDSTQAMNEPGEDRREKKTGRANRQVKHLWSTNNRDQGSDDNQESLAVAKMCKPFNKRTEDGALDLELKSRKALQRRWQPCEVCEGLQNSAGEGRGLSVRTAYEVHRENSTT